MPIVGGNPNPNTFAQQSDVFDRPPRGTLPLSKGGDLIIDFLQKINDIYTDYAAGVTVTLEIDSAPPVSVPATISTYHALCRVESDVVDRIKSDVLWRCIVGYPTIPVTEVIAINGLTVRADS